MNNQDLKMLAEALKHAIVDAEKAGKEYAEKTGENQNFAFAFGFLSARVRGIASVIEEESETSHRK